MKKIILCLIGLFSIVLAKAQDQEADNLYIKNSIVFGDSTISSMYQGTIVDDQYVIDYVAAALAAGVVPDSNFNWASADTLVTGLIQFDTTIVVPTYRKGQLYYDTVNYTLSLNTGLGGATLQIGQELYILVQNNTGVQIDNGDAVYVIDAGGEIARIALAEADNGNTAYRFIGLATVDIPHGSMGFVTIFGDTRFVNTGGMAEGEPVYLSTTAGEWSQTKPNAHIVRIGFVKYANASNGIITVNPSYETALDFAVLNIAGTDGTYIDSTKITADSADIDLAIIDSTKTPVISATNLYFDLGTTKKPGALYGGTTDPNATNRANYDGYWYATSLWSRSSAFSNTYSVLNPYDFSMVISSTTAISLAPSASGTNYAFTFNNLNDIDSILTVKKQGNPLFRVYSGGVIAEKIESDSIYSDTITAIKGKFDTIEFANGAQITDTISLKEAVESEVFDTVTMSVLVADSIRITRYTARNYIYDGATVATTISVANTYYTIKTMTLGHAVNMTVTDSTITVPKDGWYHVIWHSSGFCGTNLRSVHISLFVDDVENDAYESETRHATSGQNYHIGWAGDIYLTAGSVLKAKVKYLSNTGTYTINHAGFNVIYEP